MNDVIFDSSLPILQLKPSQTHRCLHGHLWIYRSELADGQTIPHGGCVLIRHPRHGVIGSGLASERSQIAVRLLSRSGRVIDADFVTQRVAAAIARRAGAPPCHRAVWSEGDLLPGLIVDRYLDRVVIQTTTPGMDRLQPQIVAWLQHELKPAQIIERNDLAVRDKEGLPRRSGVLVGPTETRCAVQLGELTWTIDLMDPHKTGAYLDQCANHRAVARMITPGMRVADVFSHIGGFGLHAARAGADVVCVDQAPASIAAVAAAAQQAGLADRVRTAVADAFAWLREQQKARAQYDLIVLDPPSFAPTRDALPNALRGYRDLHLQALRLLRVGGILVSYTCSSHVDETRMFECILGAAGDARRTLRLIDRHHQPPDHPILLAIPESEYLRGWVFAVEDA